MRSPSKTAYTDAGFILSAVRAWAISALVFLVLGTLYINSSEQGAEHLGYISSAISFISAVFAGRAVSKSGSSGIYYAAISAAVITTLLLTTGFIIRGASLPASGVLSVASFTFAGCLFGYVFLGKKNPIKARRHKSVFT